MCGIVCFFGRAENSLTRILTGMSAIIYRAPDSTGVGMLGDDRSPMVAVKALGALPRLVDVLVEQEFRSNPAGEILRRLFPRELETAATFAEWRRRIFVFEGLPLEGLNADREGTRSRITFRDVVNGSAAPVEPGFAGRPGRLPGWPIKGRRDLAALVETLLRDFDLSTQVCKALIGRALEAEHRRVASEASPSLPPLSEILATFDVLFERVVWEHVLNGGSTRRPPVRLLQGQAYKVLWRLLSRITVQLPPDCDNGAVRCLFRFLDGAVMSRIPGTPELGGRIQTLLSRRWPSAPPAERLSWQELYWAEKTLNVYGRAAAAVFAFACEEDPGLEAGGAGESVAIRPAVEAGRIAGEIVTCLSSPVIAHGRWALQSPITLENAHPFFDSKKQRAVVLNGQFDGTVEARLLHYLTNLGLSRRSSNSTEYLPLLWEHYFEVLSREKAHCEAMRRQIEAGLEDLDLGSQSFDYRMFKRVHDKSTAELDEMAFREAVGRMVASGGQLAAAAVSVVTPHRLYVASHDRPVFVVQRPATGDVMVVSDVNAALGLFPQFLILEKCRELVNLDRRRRELLGPPGAESESVLREMEAAVRRLEEEERKILETFRIRVIPLEGEELVAQIDRTLEGGVSGRKIRVTDFSGNPRPDVEPFELILDPLQTRKDIHGSFYESHLKEIPERIEAALKRYLPDPQAPPLLELRERALRRRFGRRMEGLKRVVLVGMGSSYNVGLMARPLFESLLPGIPVDVVKPIEVEQVPRFVDHEKDLVFLLSGSGTSADIVQFAHELARHQVSMIGVTEKPYADMALIARKSAGVIPILSGEEVTYIALKSTVSMLFAAYLAALWLAHKCAGASEDRISALAGRLEALPDTLRRVLEDRRVEAFSRRVSERSAGCHAAVVLDDLEVSGVGREVAMKLEENSWSATGKALDYHDVSTVALERDPGANFVLVHAAGERRLEDALETMALLHLARVPFCAVAHDPADPEPVKFYSGGSYALLPAVGEDLEPFVDLVFFYRLAYHFGAVHGHVDAGFPRNRAKSVTVSRSRPSRLPGPASERSALDPYAKVCEPVWLEGQEEETEWERRASVPWEGRVYRELRRLAATLCLEDPLCGLVTRTEASPGVLQQLFDATSEGGEVVLVPLDRGATAVARDVASIWSRLTHGTFRVAGSHLRVAADAEDALVIVCSTTVPREEAFPDSLESLGNLVLWVGPHFPGRLELPFSPSLGRWSLLPSWDAATPEALYAVLNQLLIEAWKRHRPQTGRVLEQTFRYGSQVIMNVLNASALRGEIRRAVEENLSFRTALFIGSHGGVGTDWAVRLDRTGSVLAESYVYGDSAHGPIVTVDPEPERKFIRLRSRVEMVALYGPERVRRWEERCLGGDSVDGFLEAADPERSPGLGSPFFSEGRWYLPVLRPDYDPTGDNLIFLDASERRDLPKALDELALFGCRYARVVLVCQEAFRHLPESADLFRYPVGHALWLPPLDVQGSPQPIPDLLLPLAMRMTATAVAACFAEAAAAQAVLPETETLFRESFGPLGTILREAKIRLRDLRHSLVEGLEHLAPLVDRAEGLSWYDVRRIESIEELETLAEEGRLYGAERILESFQEFQAKGYPCYLVRPEREHFKGVAAAIAGYAFSEDYWGLWYEVYGSSWRCLYHGAVETNEGPRGEPRIEVPLLKAGALSGRLYHFYVRYRPWEPAESLEGQVAATAKALGKHASGLDQGSTRYDKIISRFNQAMVAEGLLWADTLLVLVPRAHPLCRPSKDVAGLLADRTRELLGAAGKTGGHVSESMDAVLRALAAIWNRLEPLGEDDEQHWAVLKSAVCRQLGPCRDGTAVTTEGTQGPSIQ